jgi:hypothetical protein
MEVVDMPTRKPQITKPVVKRRHGKGVMSKDGRTPWAAGTLHATTNAGFKSPYDLSYKNVVELFAAMMQPNPTIVEIQIIDENNVESVIGLRAAEFVEDPGPRERLREEIARHNLERVRG